MLGHAISCQERGWVPRSAASLRRLIRDGRLTDATVGNLLFGRGGFNPARAMPA